MGNCMSSVPVTAPDIVTIPAPASDEKEAVIADLKLRLMYQRLELEHRCKYLELKLEQRDDDYRGQVAISTDLKAKLWLLTCEASQQRKQLTMLRGSKRVPGRD